MATHLNKTENSIVGEFAILAQKLSEESLTVKSEIIASANTNERMLEIYALSPLIARSLLALMLAGDKPVETLHWVFHALGHPELIRSTGMKVTKADVTSLRELIMINPSRMEGWVFNLLYPQIVKRYCKATKYTVVSPCRLKQVMMEESQDYLIYQKRLANLTDVTVPMVGLMSTKVFKVADFIEQRFNGMGEVVLYLSVMYGIESVEPILATFCGAKQDLYGSRLADLFTRHVRRTCGTEAVGLTLLEYAKVNYPLATKVNTYLPKGVEETFFLF